MADKKKTAGKVRRRERKSVPRGQAHIQATFNNTIVTLTDPNGNVLSWGSSGAQGFKGSRKSTPYAAQVTAESAARKAMEHGLRQIYVFVKGPGSAVRLLSVLCRLPVSLLLRLQMLHLFRIMAADRPNGVVYSPDEAHCIM